MNIDAGAPDSLASCLGVRHTRVPLPQPHPTPPRPTVFISSTSAAFPSDTLARPTGPANIWMERRQPIHQHHRKHTGLVRGLGPLNFNVD